MKLKALGNRARAHARVRRHRSSREAKVRPVQPEGRQRVWSLLLPPGFPADRR